MTDAITSQKRPSETILLITPPSVFLLDQRVFVSLGILKVAAMLENAGVPVEHLDLSGVGNYLDAAAHHLSRSQARIVGLTVTTPQLPNAIAVIEHIRALRPDMKIILGGPHVTLTHSAVKLEQKKGRVSRAHHAYERLQTYADVLVSGDGDLAIFEALRPDAPRLVDGDDPKGGLFLDNKTYDAFGY